MIPKKDPLKGLRNSSNRDEFNEMHEIAFDMNDEIERENLPVPESLEEAKDFAAPRMKYKTQHERDRVAEILIFAILRSAILARSY